MSNISSIITLKSELNKRKAEAHSKSNIRSKSPDLYTFNKSAIKCFELPKPPKKQKLEINLNKETDFDYQKAAINLEKKSKLYEKLLDNKNTLSHEDFLVDFVKKSDSDPRNNEYMKYNYSTSSEIKSNINNTIGEDSEYSYYTNVLNTEIREHGTGYYKFSSNINQRREQLDELKKFQSEVEKEKSNLNKINELEKEKLQSRLQKIKEKYDVEVPVDDLLPNFQVAEDSEENIIPENNEVTTIDSLLSEIRASTQTKTKREWDRGKRPQNFENIKKKLRDVRKDDFAPPMFY